MAINMRKAASIITRQVDRWARSGEVYRSIDDTSGHASGHGHAGGAPKLKNQNGGMPLPATMAQVAARLRGV